MSYLGYSKSVDSQSNKPSIFYNIFRHYIDPKNDVTKIDVESTVFKLRMENIFVSLLE